VSRSPCEDVVLLSLAENLIVPLIDCRHPGRVMAAGDALTSWQAAGPEDLALLEASGWRQLGPRLPGQPVFYPVPSRTAA
jgi:hypothetical protein